MLFPERRQPPMAASQQQNNAAGLAASQARKSRGEREREEMQRGQVGGIAPRLPKSRAVSPSGGDRVPPEQLAALYSKRVEEEMRRRKEMDRGWEDSADVSRCRSWLRSGDAGLLTPIHGSSCAHRSDIIQSRLPSPSGTFGTSHSQNSHLPAAVPPSNSLASIGRRLRSQRRQDAPTTRRPFGCVAVGVESCASIAAVVQTRSVRAARSRGEEREPSENSQDGTRSRMSTRSFQERGRRVTTKPYDRRTAWTSTERNLRSGMIRNRLRSARERGS
jgi:hypothetical protein